jgi:hypothetical protein
MKKLIFICALLMAVPVAQAAISGTTGAVTSGTIPADLTTGASESDSYIYVYPEQSEVTLGAGLDVDITSTGTYDEWADLTPGTIPIDTVVDSFIAHFDKVGDSGTLVSLAGTVTFDTPILGIVIITEKLDASDDPVGVGTTTYESDSPDPTWHDYREAELNGSQDTVILVDAYTVEFDVLATGQAIDEVRIITEVLKAEIDKTVEAADSGVDADLGDHLTVELVVDNPYSENVTVVDELPDGLAYIPDIDPVTVGNQNLTIDGSDATPTLVDNTVSVEVGPGSHTIVFEVQVVEVQADEVTVDNVAKVYAPAATEPDNTDSVDITLYPYDGFGKDVEVAVYVDDWDYDDEIGIVGDTIDPWDQVPMETQVVWVMFIWVEDVVGDEVDMTDVDVLVKDNLGGDLTLYAFDPEDTEEPFDIWQELVAYTFEGFLGIVVDDRFDAVTRGNTDKIQMSWEIDEFDGDETLLILPGTDLNPGQKKKDAPKWEYTTADDHYLNSGATLKFVDPDTGLQLSAHTPALMVTANAP